MNLENVLKGGSEIVGYTQLKLPVQCSYDQNALLFECGTFSVSSKSTSLTSLNKHQLATEGLKRLHTTAHTDTNQTVTISAFTPTRDIRQRKNRLRSRDAPEFQSINVNFNGCCSFLLHFSSSSEKSVQTQKGLLFFCFFYMLRMQEWTTRGIIKMIMAQDVLDIISITNF